MGKRLYVGNLNYRTTEDMLREAFGEFGEVADCTIIEGRGFGFIEMGTEQEAEEAREGLNGEELDGRRLRVDEAHDRPQRDDRRGGGGGGRGGYGGGGGGGRGGYGGGGGGGRDRDRW
ncbi:MAG: RNA-binding protein [Candidatus Poribacteria bacterium]|nr:RNA-binding protein [Candidatus Poribacteria bacterium]